MKADKEKKLGYRLIDARSAQIGEVWRNLKTGKTCEIIGDAGIWGLKLRHESGRETTKQPHYFAYEYEKIEQP